MRSGVEDEEKRSKWTSHFDSSGKAQTKAWESPSDFDQFSNLINVWPRFHSSSALCPHRLPPSSTSGLIAWSAFEADKFCLYDFVSSSAIWPSDYESDYGLPTSTPRPHPSSTNDFSTTSSSPTLVSTASTGLIAWFCLRGRHALAGTVWLSDYESDASTLRHYLFVLCASACPATQFYFIVCGNFERSTSLYSNYRSIIKVWGMQNMVGTLARIIYASSLDSYAESSYSPHHPFGPSFSIKPAYVSMAPSTRNAARRGATGTGTHDPTVSGTYVMRTRSGVAINPPAKQNNKRQRNAVPSHLLLRMTLTGQNLVLYPDVPRLQSDHPPDTPDIDDDVPVTDTRMDDDERYEGSDNDADDDMTNEDREHSQANEDEDEDNDGSYIVGKADGCHREDNVEGDSDNDAKDGDEEPEGGDEELEGGDEEPEGGENNKDFETSQARRLRPRRVKRSSYNLHFDDGSQSSSSDTSYREGPATSDQDSAHDPSSPPAKRRKRSSAIETTLANTSQKTSHSTTVRKKHAAISHGGNPTPASIVFGPTPDIDNSENEDEPSGHLKRGRLCQEGIDEAQELGQKTAEEARVIGAKYGNIHDQSLIGMPTNAGSWIITPARTKNVSPPFCGVYDANSRVSAIIDWKERQRKTYAMGKDDEEWDIIRNYNVTGGNTNQSRAKTILSMREDIARKLSAYSRLEGVEAIGCIFDTTQDEAARQASGFVAGSDLIVKLINEHQLDARAILDWVVTATKAKGYNISVPQFMGGVGAYEILLSKPNEAPRDRYRRIWPIMVLEHTSKFGYQPKAVQWRKLLDYAFQYKFMIKNWPEDVLPIGPEFNPHNLSSQHLKLLVVPFIKRKAHSYYEAELRTEAESLLELEKRSRRASAEIEFAAWPDECIKQLNDEVPEMFDIPLVTSALDVVLRKLVDSAKFKASVPEDILAAHEAHPDVPNVFDRESRPVLPTSRDEPVGGGRRQASLPFKAKKPLRVDPTFMRRMEERPADSRNDADLELAPYPGPRREDRDFVAPNRRREYSRSPPVYPQRDPSRSRQRETFLSLSDDGSYPGRPAHSRRQNHADDFNQRFQVRRAGDSHYEDGPSRFRY
ncbi:hypothetical protein DFJ58DRAFT_847813 [Suillus subalutaceus]|uniref:uncharacterized protein n=1 Tax=Suillus subalutaceus TaxID=48586 RepID=UPI001B871C51|nr:uncharacterized protein DFJ58DRAFT_847813 [Suillus subalutaceus]KAG1833601.1 hypothetical protein DFJ58DRAFT_847813 [Suillus subalutaceus]